MKIAIVHLSDIHVKTAGDFILTRASAIASTVKNIAPCADVHMLAVTGDVAFSGKINEYQLAAPFLQSIATELQEAGVSFMWFFLPGNHDIDVDNQPDTRDALISHVRQHPNAFDIKGETAKQILSVQQNFFKFEAAMLGTNPRPIADQLIYSQTLSMGEKNIRVRCLNTAWISTNPEEAAKLVFPVNAIAQQPENDIDVEITAFHHPTDWLESDNRRNFRLAVQSSADLILTGHEHKFSNYRVDSDVVGTYQHVEGSVLQNSKTGESTFNVIVIDDDAQQYEVFVCSWDGGKYQARSSGEHSFTRNAAARGSFCSNTATFQSYLDDAGLPIIHPKKHMVSLRDLFVYPPLARKDPIKKFDTLQTIDSRNVLEFIRSTPRLVLMGEETSGKTSLAKHLYQELAKAQLVPLLLNGASFDGYRSRDIKRVLSSAVVAQYGEKAVDEYFSLNSSQRLLLIDDWDALKYVNSAKSSVLAELKARADRIIYFTNRLYTIEELADNAPAREMFGDCQFCDISELGRRETGRLIEKWHSLGRDAEFLGRPEFHDAVSSSENKVAAVMAKGLLPTFPIFVIASLQADSSPSATSSQNTGAYGHIIEMLITDRLMQVSSNAASVGTFYTYLSRIAYYLFKQDAESLSAVQMTAVHEEYCSSYQMLLLQEEMLKSLTAANILCRESGSICFRYKGVYCYCVARYLFENMQEASQLRSELDEMTDRLAFEDYANIVMLYLYLTRDPATIDRLVKNAYEIYAECEPANLGGDVAFVNSLMLEPPEELLLPSMDIMHNRDRNRERQDLLDAQEQHGLLSAPERRVSYADASHEIIRFSIGMQTLRVMGQVLRNFPGVLPGGPKLRLAEASYLLGLRMLRRVYDVIQNDVQMLRVGFAEVYRERHPLSTESELARTADQTVIWFAGAATYGMLKRICKSIGLKDLELTFNQVGDRLGQTLAVRLTNIAIALEHFKDVPKAEILGLEKKLRDVNRFGYKILRDLIYEFLYLRNTNHRLAQELGAKERFDIATSNPAFSLNKAVGASVPSSRHQK